MTVDRLLDFIAEPESNNNPNAVWGKIAREDRPNRPLTSMTVGEILAWQDSIDAKYMSEAAGAWQFMEDTLRGLYRQAGVALTEKFTEATQRRLATQLLRRRGLDDYLAGRISAESFAQNLSKEWASLPAITRDRQGRPAEGQSYYAGDGLNKSHVSIADTLSAVKAVRSAPRPDPKTSPVKSTTIVAGGAIVGAEAVQQSPDLLAVLSGIGAMFDIPPDMIVGIVQVAAALWIVYERYRKFRDGRDR